MDSPLRKLEVSSSFLVHWTLPDLTVMPPRFAKSWREIQIRGARRLRKIFVLPNLKFLENFCWATGLLFIICLYIFWAVVGGKPFAQLDPLQESLVTAGSRDPRAWPGSRVHQSNALKVENHIVDKNEFSQKTKIFFHIKFYSCD